MSWNPNDDYRPSPPPIAADMEDVQTAWGILPRWKARALALGEIQAVVNELHGGVTIRNDAASGRERLGLRRRSRRRWRRMQRSLSRSSTPTCSMPSKASSTSWPPAWIVSNGRSAPRRLCWRLKDEIERRYPPTEDDDDDEDMTLKPRRH